MVADVTSDYRKMALAQALRRLRCHAAAGVSHARGPGPRRPSLRLGPGRGPAPTAHSVPGRYDDSNVVEGLGQIRDAVVLRCLVELSIFGSRTDSAASPVART